MSYRLDVKITEGFDIEGDYEYDAFNGFTVLGGSFENVEYNILPMR